MISGSSKRPPISAAPGTGTAIPARPATSRATSTCRCSKRPATCRCANMRRRPRSTSIAAASAALRPLRACLFQTVITRMGWQEQEARWLVETDRGDRIRARFVIMAGGPLSRPKLPGIPGIESFKGHSFHTSRWDYAYTGGDCRGRSDRPRRQARRHHRHRRDRDPVRPASRPLGQGALRLPAHAVLGRRARQPADRSDWARASSLAGSASAWTISPPYLGRAVRAGSGAATAGPACSATSAAPRRQTQPVTSIEER